jgi:hypothetical protein
MIPSHIHSLKHELCYLKLTYFLSLEYRTKTLKSPPFNAGIQYMVMVLTG